MKVEIGDYISHIVGVDSRRGVVVEVERKPYGMGEVYHVVSTTGVREEVEDQNLVADYGHTRSRTHEWADGQQAEYDSLPAHGRRLYDQLRTRLWQFEHTSALRYAQAVQSS